MRILRIAQDMYPEVLGGGSYHTHAMSRDQGHLGHDVTALTVSSDELATTTPTEACDGYTLIRRSPTISVLGNGISVGVMNYLRRYADDFDIIHAHSHVYPATNVAALSAVLTNVPLAVTCHGLYSVSVPEWVSKAHLRTLGRWTYDAADVVFTYTAVERRELFEYGVDADVRVISNGIDPMQFTPDGETVPEMDTEKTALLFVGRLAAGKRPGDAVRVVDRLVPHHDVHLFFCGDGPLRTELEAEVRNRGLEEYITFLGTIPYDDMPAVYRSADVFVLTSRAEGFPRTVLEALSSGLPVVTSRLEQIEEVAEMAGHTVKIGDVSGFANAVSELVGEPTECERLGMAGREIVESSYNWSDTVRRTTDHLERISTDV